MSIHVALNHVTHYRYDREIALGPQLVRLVFPDQIRELRIEVDLVAEMAVQNPFDFFLAPHADAAVHRLSGTN